MDLVLGSKRGVFLTLVLFAFSMGILGSLFNNEQSLEAFSNLWINPVTLFLAKVVFDIYFLGGIWLWKKSGLYGKLLLDLVITLYLIYWQVTNTTDAFTLPVLLFSALLSYALTDGMLFFAAKRKWQYFK